MNDRDGVNASRKGIKQGTAKACGVLHRLLNSVVIDYRHIQWELGGGTLDPSIALLDF